MTLSLAGEHRRLLPKGGAAEGEIARVDLRGVYLEPVAVVGVPARAP